MFNGKYTTVDEILEMVSRDLEFELQRDEVMEWIWEIVNLIGSPESFEDKSTTITITDYRGILPLNFHMSKPGGIREIISGASLREMTDSGYLFSNVSTPNGVIIQEGETTVIDSNGNVLEGYGFTSDPSNIKIQQLTYRIKGQYIYTGFENGGLQVSYVAFPIEDSGFPKIPDVAEYKRAVQYYIASKIAMRLKLKDKISREDKNDIEQKYAFYVAQAKNIMALPSPDFMESLKNRWLSIRSTTTEQTAGFKYLNDVQSIRKM